MRPLAGVLLSIFLPAHFASAATIHVPGDQPTIQAGIDAAQAGDIVLVAPGTYDEHLFMKSGVTLRSEMGPPTTVVRSWFGTSVTCEEVTDVLIQGMVLAEGYGTIRGRELMGGSLLCIASLVAVEDCVLEGCTLYGSSIPDLDMAAGGGLACVGGSAVTIENCTIHANAVYGDLECGCYAGGGGLYCDSLSTARVCASRIEGNYADFGGGIASRSPSVVVEDCTLEGNDAWYVGGGFNGTGTIRRCVVRGNGGRSLWTQVGGIAIGLGGVVEECLVVGNGAVAYCGGILASSGSTVRRTTVFGNRASMVAGGIWVAPEYVHLPVTIENNIVVDNGCGIFGDPPWEQIHTIRCNDVWGNGGGDYCGCPDPTGTEGNIWVNPLFCDAGAGNFTLDCRSPCAPAQQPECGLMGAFGVGCGATATVPATWGLVKHLFQMPER